VSRLDVFGLEFDPVTEGAAVDRVIELTQSRRGAMVVTPNLELMRQVHERPEARRHVEAADLVLADGAPVVWASRIAGRPLPERVAGSSIFEPVARRAAAAGVSLFLLGGGEPTVADRLAEQLTASIPGLDIVGTYCPPRGFLDDPREFDAMVTAVGEHTPQLVAIGLPFEVGSRTAELLIDRLPETCFFNVGVTFSFLAGDIRRAPLWMQRTGLEWLHRLLQEPRRLARRYLVDGPAIAARLILWSVRTRLRGG
jgi:N-acetylglucosaminyldiphosphoundecaprenol N-acetyl-beta-D-mannosaminyltransferase